MLARIAQSCRGRAGRVSGTLHLGRDRQAGPSPSRPVLALSSPSQRLSHLALALGGIVEALQVVSEEVQGPPNDQASCCTLAGQPVVALAGRLKLRQGVFVQGRKDQGIRSSAAKAS